MKKFILSLALALLPVVNNFGAGEAVSPTTSTTVSETTSVSEPAPYVPETPTATSSGGGGGTTNVQPSTPEPVSLATVSVIPFRDFAPTSESPDDYREVPLGTFAKVNDVVLTLSGSSEDYRHVLLVLERGGNVQNPRTEIYLETGDKESPNFGPFYFDSAWGHATVGAIALQNNVPLRVKVFVRVLNHEMNGDTSQKPIINVAVTGVVPLSYLSLDRSMSPSGLFPIRGYDRVVNPNIWYESLSFVKADAVSNIIRGAELQTFSAFKARAIGNVTQKGLSFLFRTDGNISAIERVAIVRENGQIVTEFRGLAGEKKEMGGIYFPESITFYDGEETLYLKGKVGENFDGTYIEVLSPQVGIGSAVGLSTRYEFIADTDSVWGNKMMVIKPSLTITVGTQSPVEKKVIAGEVQVEGLRVKLDATQSAGGIITHELMAQLVTSAGISPTSITDAAFFDADTGERLSQFVNPSRSGDHRFKMQQGVLTEQGSIRNLVLRYNSSFSAVGGMVIWYATGSTKWGQFSSILTSETVTPTGIYGAGDTVRFIASGKVSISSNFEGIQGVKINQSSSTLASLNIQVEDETIGGSANAFINLYVWTPDSSIFQVGGLVLNLGGVESYGDLSLYYGIPEIGEVRFPIPSNVEIPKGGSITATLEGVLNNFKANQTIYVWYEGRGFLVGRNSGMNIPIKYDGNEFFSVLITKE